MTAAPPNALRIWHSSGQIYVEVPGRLGPYVTSYPCNSRGLLLLLSLIGLHATDFDSPSTTPIPEAYRSNFTSAKGTTAQQEEARRLLKQAGIIG